LSDLLADTLGLTSEQPAAFIRYVTEGSAGANAGLQSFSFELLTDDNIVLVNNIDIIQAVNGTPVSSLDDFYSEMEDVSAGQTITLDVLRATQTYNGGLNTSTENLQVSVTAEELLPDVTASGQALLD